MKVVIVSAVNHDGKDLKVSSKPVELPNDVAIPLLKAGAAVKPGHQAAVALAEEEEARDEAEKVVLAAQAAADADEAAAAAAAEEERKKAAK